MDGLRLALIIAGIVVVAVVYWWTSRRRRMEREAGDFDRFDAWTDDSLDPLSDEESVTQPNPRRVRPLVPDGVGVAGSSTGDPDALSEGAAGSQDGNQGASIGGPAVLEGLEAIADSLDTRLEPSIGDVAKVEDEPPAAASPAPRRDRATGTGGADATKPAAAPADSEPPALVMVINVMAPVGATFEGPPLREALENAGLRAGEMKLYHYLTEAQPAGSQPIFSALNMVKPGTLAPEQFEGLRTPGVALVMRLPGPERPIEAFELMHGTATSMAAELGGRLCDESRSALTRQALNHMRERIAELVRRRRAGV